MRIHARTPKVQLIVFLGLAVFWLLSFNSAAAGHTPESESTELATSLASAVTAADFDRASGFLAPDAVVTFQNGDVQRGRDEISKYVRELFSEKGGLVQAYSGSPVVASVTSIDESTRVVTGTSADQMTLSSGAPLFLDTRWTATIVRRDGAWKIASLHLSTNMLDNPIIDKMKTTSYLLAAFGLVMGITIGLGVSMLLRRRSAPAH